MKKGIILLCSLLMVASQLKGQAPTRYNLKLGDKFIVTSEVVQNISQSMMGQSMTTDQNITTVDLYEVVEVSDNSYKFKTTGLNRKMDMMAPGTSLALDSDGEGDEHLAVKALTGKSYFIEMNIYGKVLDITGLDELANEVKADLVGTPIESTTTELLAAFNKETLTTAFEGQFYVYKEPNESTWSRKMDMVVNNLPISLTLDYSVSGANEISAAGDMTLDGEITVQGMAITAKMNGIQSTKYELDGATGMSRKITTEQDMQGDLEVQGMTVPMTLKTKVNVTIENK